MHKFNVRRYLSRRRVQRGPIDSWLRRSILPRRDRSIPRVVPSAFCCLLRLSSGTETGIIDLICEVALEVTLRKLLLSSGTRSLARARRNVEIYLKDFIKVSKKFERQPEIHRYIRGISLSGLSSLFSPHNKWKSSRDTSRELPRRAAINLRNILSGVSLTVTADKSRFNRRRMYLISNEFTSFRLSRLPAAAAAAATAAAASSPRVLSR
jgi:hypothetical protein